MIVLLIGGAALTTTILAVLLEVLAEHKHCKRMTHLRNIADQRMEDSYRA